MRDRRLPAGAAAQAGNAKIIRPMNTCTHHPVCTQEKTILLSSIPPFSGGDFFLFKGVRWQARYVE